MGIHNRAMVRAFGFALATVIALPLAAQEPSKGKTTDTQKPPVEKKVFDASRRVPSHFGQVGLTPEQKEEIYKIRGKHQSQVESLQKQIAQLQGEMMTECESILSESQKQLLALRREAATRARKARIATAETTASSKPAKPAN